MSDPHCRIGRVRPRLALHRGNDKVYEPDFNDEVGFVEDMIEAVRQNANAVGYTMIVTHRDGSVTRGSKGLRSGCDFQMLGRRGI